jgi:hypothetical protein
MLSWGDKGVDKGVKVNFMKHAFRTFPDITFQPRVVH